MLFLPDYVQVVYVIVSVLYCNPLRVCRVVVNSHSQTLPYFFPSRRLYQRFGSGVMNIHAPSSFWNSIETSRLFVNAPTHVPNG
jgi:hypothetical protein